MPQSFASVHLHLVFSTKNRFPWLADKALRTEMHHFLATCSNELDCPCVEVGGVEDHVHVLAQLPRTLTLADWVKEIKRVSSRWAKIRAPEWADFRWQNGYAVFGVSERNVQKAMTYIQNQEEHHHHTSFQDEYRHLLRAHKLKWDEAHLWD
jgi:putative transposase